MRKIVTGLFMSLDGVVDAPSTWAGPYFDDQLTEMMGAGIAQADAILLGRRTYLEFAATWPDQVDGASTTPSSDMNRPATILRIPASRLLVGN